MKMAVAKKAVAKKKATTRKAAVAKNRPLVIARTYSAGVEIGELVSLKGTRAVLANSRKLWRWDGANTLHEVSLYGAGEKYTRLSEPVESVILTECIEIIPVAKEAIENLTRSRWGE